MITAVVNKNSNFRNIIVVTVWLRIMPLVIYPTKEERGNVVHLINFFKLSPSINRKYFIWIIMNTQDTNIGWRQVIDKSGLFTFETWQKDILAHIHGHCNTICGYAYFFAFVWIFGFCIVPSNNQLGFFENVMKGCATLILCIVYFAHLIRHMWWHPSCFLLHQQHHCHHHHHRHHYHQLNHPIFHMIIS